MMRIIMIVTIVWIIGCAGQVRPVPISYQMVDDIEHQRLVLKYENSSDRTLCLSPEMWPNAAGKIHGASDTMRLVVGGEEFPVQDFNTGYCLGGCAVRVAPDEEISASVSYKDFNLPAWATDEPKKLNFSPKAYECPD